MSNNIHDFLNEIIKLYGDMLEEVAKENTELRRIAYRNEELCENCIHNQTSCPAVDGDDERRGGVEKCKSCACATCEDGNNWVMRNG